MSTQGVSTNPDRTVDADDPRQQIEIGVLMQNGRLVALPFSTRAEAEAWARPEEGEMVVEYNPLAECSFNSC